MDYLNKMTVKELREIAARMECKIPSIPLSKARKADLIMVIEAVLEYDHTVALDMNENLVKDDEFLVAGILWTGPTARVLKAHDKMVRRFNPAMTRDKDGVVKLTPKQRRRIHKNDRRNMKRLDLFKA